MKVAIDLPPLWDEIQPHFKLPDTPRVLFAWGDTIYNPAGVDVPACLMDHEMVHGRRQGTDVVGWWRRYMEDPVFRLNEEIPAHIAELEALWDTAEDRIDRRRYLKQTAKRLAAPLYKMPISRAEAAKLLKASQKGRR